jgi:hypothetical protein
MLCDEQARAHAAPTSAWAAVTEPPGLHPELSTTETNPFADMTEGNKAGNGTGTKADTGKGQDMGKGGDHVEYPEYMRQMYGQQYSEPQFVQFTEMMEHIDRRMDGIGETVHYHGQSQHRLEQKLVGIQQLLEDTREEAAISFSHLMKKLKSISQNMNDHSSSSSSARASIPQTLRGDEELASSVTEAGFEVLPAEE